MQRWMQACLVATTLWWGGLASAAPEVPEAPPPAAEQVAVDEAPAEEALEATADEAPEAAAMDAAEGEADEEVPLEEIPLEEEPSPWSVGLMSSMIALGIGGLAAILGIWVDRDPKRPVAFAGAMSVLIGSAVGVGMVQSYLDAVGAIQARADLDRMLDMVGEISAESDDPALAAMLEEENQRRGRRKRPAN